MSPRCTALLAMGLVSTRASRVSAGIVTDSDAAACAASLASGACAGLSCAKQENATSMIEAIAQARARGSAMERTRATMAEIVVVLAILLPPVGSFGGMSD